MQNLNSQKSLLLSGVRVADFSRILVGAYSSMLLADLGAEVIKIEAPNGGDETRSWGPPFRGSDSTYYLSINRNKKSFILDLKQATGQRVALDLIKKSDIVIENFTYGKMKDFNLDYEVAKKAKEDIIYATVNSYGNFGPMRSNPAFDLIIQAFCGVMHITGGAETEPFKVGYPMCDIMTGAHIYSAILAALLHKNKTGEGQYLNSSLLEANLFAMPTIASAFLNGNINNKRRGNDHPSISPYTVFKLKSGDYIAIGVATSYQFSKLWKILEIEKYLQQTLKKNSKNEDITYEKDFATNKLRIENRELLKEIIQNRLFEFDENFIFEKFEKFAIPFSKINSMKDLFGDYDKPDNITLQTQQLKELELVQEIETKDFGKLKYIRNPITYDKIKLKEIETPPTYGKHTNEILSGILNYDTSEINRLKENKVVFDI